MIQVKTGGVKGDERSYEGATNLRAVISEDAMTAEWVDLPAPLLRETSQCILNEVSGINRVLYDISTKPPASICLLSPSPSTPHEGESRIPSPP